MTRTKGEAGMDSMELIRKLSSAFGPPGFEHEVRAVLTSLVKPLVDEVRVDALGNLIAVRNGTSPKKVMLDAHMDEVGFMVSHIDERGFLRLAPLGGWDARILPSHAITVQTRKGTKLRGIIGSAPPHILTDEDRKKPFHLEDLFVDVGAASREEAHALGLRVGDPAVIEYPFQQVNANTLTGKAFDDRAGCAVAVKVLHALQHQTPSWTVVACFVVREEVGLRGAQTAAYQVQPDVALALEGTVAADVPGVAAHKQPTALGKGPAISVADHSFVVPREIVVLLEELAQANNVPFQHKTPPYGSTDAGAIHQSRKGVACGVLSVPCRYIHAPISMLRLPDFEGTVQLATAFVKAAPERFSA